LCKKFIKGEDRLRKWPFGGLRSKKGELLRNIREEGDRQENIYKKKNGRKEYIYFSGISRGIRRARRGKREESAHL